MKLTMELSESDLAAIGHVVVDPAAWAQHAFDNVGAQAVRDKIAKYRTEFEAAQLKHGANYKTRAQRDAEEDADRALEEAAKAEVARAAAEQAEAARRAAFAEAVAAEVQKVLGK